MLDLSQKRPFLRRILLFCDPFRGVGRGRCCTPQARVKSSATRGTDHAGRPRTLRARPREEAAARGCWRAAAMEPLIIEASSGEIYATDTLWLRLLAQAPDHPVSLTESLVPPGFPGREVIWAGWRRRGVPVHHVRRRRSDPEHAPDPVASIAAGRWLRHGYTSDRSASAVAWGALMGAKCVSATSR
jgi:hypothetical protein